MNWLLEGDFTATPLDYRLVFLALLLGFACGHVVAWSYMLTHTGLSYSRSFVNSLVILPVIVALVIMVLSNNFVTAFGLLGVLSIVRFRNVLRDTFDTSFLLSAVALGLACGTQKFRSAIIGCLVITAVTVYLWYTGFGTRHRYGMIVSLNWSGEMSQLGELESVLRRHCRRTYCASRRSSGEGGTDLSYRLLLRDPNRANELIEELRSSRRVNRISSIDVEDQLEV
jgi:Domain of unknown function (DUF4956)